MLELALPTAMLEWSRATRAAGRMVGFVPTMGYLHEGHLRLIDRAQRHADAVVTSVFVNPIQFGEDEDFDSYPRDLDRDRAALHARGVACLFAPSTSDMYPSPPIVQVVPGSLARHLCGRSRPGHFDGVLTVVCKLFNIVQPDVAVFGRKDIQQALIIQRMVQDLSFPLSVLIAPTVREADGLAMSSRNRYLSSTERTSATRISQGLTEAHQLFLNGERQTSALVAAARRVMEVDPVVEVEYVELVDAETLSPAREPGADSILAAAAHVGRARLIDNIVLGEGMSVDERVGA